MSSGNRVRNQWPATFLLVLLLLLAPYLSSATFYYVKPTEPHNAPCPVNPCYTLEEFVDNATQFFYSVSNITARLLPGVHILNQRLGIAACFTFMDIYSDPTNSIHGISIANITCGRYCGLRFSNSADVKIEKIAIISQEPVTFAYVSNLTMTQVVTISAQIAIFFATNVHLFQVIIEGSGNKNLLPY